MNDLRLNYDDSIKAYEIRYKDFLWVNDGEKPNVILREKTEEGYVKTRCLLQNAQHQEITKTESKITVRYSGFEGKHGMYSLELLCTAEITGDNTVCFAVKTEHDGECDIESVYFPGAFNSVESGEDSYGVESIRQGLLVPDGYEHMEYLPLQREVNSGGCYMPIWGRVCDKTGFSAIVETPYDMISQSAVGKRESFVTSVNWLSSLGKLGYERKVRFTFHENCDYNEIAKDYRAYLIEKGEFVSIKDKIETNKNIEKLIGCPVLHHKIYTNTQPESSFYDKDGTNDFVYAAFEKRADQMRRMKELGLEKLYIHTDGWGEQGYDNNHPYILPPCPKAGGWEGMKKLADTCREVGYIFALHDQYRDYYYSSKKYDPEKAVMNYDGSHPYCSIWDGGEHSFLCASFAPEFVKMTYEELKEHGIDVQGAYLDVFSIVPGDECFHPDHRITREQNIQYRKECFDYMNGKGMIMSSEEPGMQMTDKLALVHHGPYCVYPQGEGVRVGIPVPLTSLVLHDCLMIPWGLYTHWGIPIGESGEAYCALHAGMPYLEPFTTTSVKVGTNVLPADMDLKADDELKVEIEKVKELAALQRKLYDKEMIRHEFLDGTKVQRTTYSDGTKITADVEKGTYLIENPGR